MKLRLLRRIISVVFAVAVVAGSAFVFFEWQTIKDNFTVMNYSPSAEISQITDKLELTNMAKRTFFATRPELQSSSEFNQSCTNMLEESAVLGCYKNDYIYIYNVADSDLNGVKESTSAHELLHAVWVRLGSDKREELKQLLSADYERLKTPELEKTMDNYAQTEPGQHENELHSILATEFDDLSPELERHYKDIFNNRQSVVQFHKNYRQKFNQLKQRSDEIAQTMSDIKADIDGKSEAYERNLAALNTEIENFNQRANSGFYSDQTSFNADRNALINKVDLMNSQRDYINSQVEEFNRLRAEVENNSVQLNKLNESINSHLKDPVNI